LLLLLHFYCSALSVPAILPPHKNVHDTNI
jgi:hypothetical protein